MFRDLNIFHCSLTKLFTSISEHEPEGGLKDDIDTLFDLIHAAGPAPVTPAPNRSGSISQQSSDDQDPSNVDAGVAASSLDQEWSLDGVCQWTNVSRICWSGGLQDRRCGLWLETFNDSANWFRTESLFGNFLLYCCYWYIMHKSADYAQLLMTAVTD